MIGHVWISFLKGSIYSVIHSNDPIHRGVVWYDLQQSPEQCCRIMISSNVHGNMQWLTKWVYTRIIQDTFSSFTGSFTILHLFFIHREWGPVSYHTPRIYLIHQSPQNFRELRSFNRSSLGLLPFYHPLLMEFLSFHRSTTGFLPLYHPLPLNF